MTTTRPSPIPVPEPARAPAKTKAGFPVPKVSLVRPGQKTLLHDVALHAVVGAAIYFGCTFFAGSPSERALLYIVGAVQLLSLWQLYRVRLPESAEWTIAIANLSALALLFALK